jgi:peptidoglycan/LPS O-acetylase OafA/YrhL
VQIIKEKVIELDIMRSIAITFIILLHLANYLNYLNILVFPFGNYGLGTFIFLSGYLMQYQYPNINRATEIVSFYKRRFFKIYPLYWLALLTFIITFGIISPKFGYGSLINFNMSSFYIIIHILGAQILLAPRYLTPAPTLWYIGAILLYYLIYPILVIKLKNIYELIARCFIIFTLLGIIHFLVGIIDIRFFLYFFIFISGIIVSYQNIFADPKYNNYLVFFLLIWLFMVTYWKQMTFNFNAQQQVIFFNVLVISFEMGLYYIIKYFKNSFFGYHKSLFSQIAINSYCIYLFHRPIMSIFYGVNKLLHLTPIINDIVMIGFSIPVVYIISNYIQKLESKYLSTGKLN